MQKLEINLERLSPFYRAELERRQQTWDHEDRITDIDNLKFFRAMRHRLTEDSLLTGIPLPAGLDDIIDFYTDRVMGL